MARYITYYISSNGQPANGEREWTTRKHALAEAKRNDGAVIHRSGGCSVCVRLEDGAEWPPQDCADSRMSIIRKHTAGAEGWYFEATPSHPIDY